MQTQDLKYIKYKHQMERKKIDKIQSSSHLIDSEYRPAKSHIFFVDSQKQGLFILLKKIIFFFFLKYKSKI
jgi:U3 small nucleolar RNA-associated protein 11